MDPGECVLLCVGVRLWQSPRSAVRGFPDGYDKNDSQRSVGEQGGNPGKHGRRSTFLCLLIVLSGGGDYECDSCRVYCLGVKSGSGRSAEKRNNPGWAGLGGGVRARPATAKRSSSASVAFTPCQQDLHTSSSHSSSIGRSKVTPEKQRPHVSGAALRHLLGPPAEPAICPLGRATALRPRSLSPSRLPASNSVSLLPGQHNQASKHWQAALRAPPL
jgi:hypothetical protein